MWHAVETLAIFGPLLAMLAWAAWQEWNTKRIRPHIPHDTKGTDL